MPSFPKVAAGVVRVVALLALFAAGVELGARVEDLARFGIPLTSGATSLEALLVRDSLGMHARPGAAFRQFRINALGFRGPEVTRAGLPQGRLVITSGASETFGLYESPGREWPAQLADSLRARCGAGGAMVQNSAFAGMSLPTVIQDLRLRVLPLHPKVVVYYFSPELYLYGDAPRPMPPVRGIAPPPGPWSSRALPRVRDAVKRAVPAALLDALREVRIRRSRSTGVTPWEAVPIERLDSVEAHLRELVGAVRAGGAQVVLGVHQARFGDTSQVAERRWLRAWEVQVPKARAWMMLAFDSLAGARMRKVAADSGVAVFDPSLAARPDRPALFADFSHFTDRGAALVAGAAAAPIAALLGCAPAPSAPGAAAEARR